MKRGLTALIIALASISYVQGQDIRIGNQDISIVLIIPLALIILVGIVFLFTFLMDTKSYSSKKNTSEVIVKPKEEIEVIKPKIWVNYLDVIDTFIKRLNDREPKEAFPIFVRIVRGFFKDRFNLDYEFTYDELLSELNKKSFTRTDLIKILRDSTYRDKKISKNDIYDLTNQFREIIKIVDGEKLQALSREKLNKNLRIMNKASDAIKNIQNKENRVDDRLNKFFIEKTKSIFKHKEIELKRDYQDFDQDKVQQISLLIRQGIKALENNDKDDLKNIYSDICYLFPFLSDKGKKVAYIEILDFYEEINKKLFPDLYKKIKN